MPTSVQVKGPPAEQFWRKYSNRQEFPLSAVGAILLHVVAAAFVVFALFQLSARAPERAAVPMQLIEGDDDHGDGTATPGGTQAVQRGESNPFDPRDDAVISDPLPLPVPSPAFPDLPAPDVAATPDAAPFSNLDKLLPKGTPGGKPGAGDKKGNGPAGGADSTGARTMRWVLRFRTTSGEDYIAQLAAMGATIVVPIPPANKEALYFPNLKNLKNVRPPTLEDTRLIASQVKFSDSREGSIAGVVGVLKLDFTPKTFWAVFPKPVEEELDRKERVYRNRRAEDIQETIFRVTIADGKYALTVDDQTIKR